MKCRKNVGELTPTEKAQLVQAFLDLKDPAKSPSRIPAAATRVTTGGGTPNRYDDYVWLHNTVGVGAHRGPAFGPWHREFLHQFEFDLQQVSGDPHLTLPYWDWTTARSSASAGWPFTNDLLGGFGSAGPGVTTGVVTSGPFANPATWRMNIRRTGDSDVTLKRSNGIPNGNQLPTRADALLGLGVGVAAGTTWPDVYDFAPWNDTTQPGPTNAQILGSFRKYLERLLHDFVHVWIGGAWEFNAQGNPGDGGHMTFPAVAVNDPVFWLHHCNVDRLWSIWQRKAAAAGYLPQVPGTATAGHNGDDLMVNLSDASWFNAPMFSTPNDVEDHHDLDYWFHTDLPQVTLDTPSVSFGTVPELLTTFRPIMFTVRTCQPVRFELTAVTGTNFAAPAAQGTVVVDHVHTSDTVTARVYVQFQAGGTLSLPQSGTATVRAYIVDSDGYDAANPGDQFTLNTWTVNLSATPVARPRAAISLVLDRSGSMWAGAGVAGTRYDLLKESLAVVRDVMRPLDGVGVVTFDDLTTVLDQITAMGSQPTTPGSGREVLESAIASPDLVPRGLTGIGQGMIEGADILDTERLSAGTPYQQFALCVMTDGNQNQTPGVTDASVTAAIAPYTSSVYAIGLGNPGGVSDAVLTSISRYMLITGDITVAERRFRLTKYFIQILAGITRSAIVVDPQGDLAIGSEHRIPFVLGEQDHQVDVIVLSPLARLLEVVLEAPDGSVIDPASGLPTVQHQANLDDVLYRLTLPLDPAIATTGAWTAVLRLPKDALDKLAEDRDGWQDRLAQVGRSGTVPYSLIVQSYSDVELDAEVKPSLCVAGDKVELVARLTAFGQPFTSRARVSVRVTEPAGTESLVMLDPQGDGSFTTVLATVDPGVYQLRFQAVGRGRGVSRFQREEVRTVAAYKTEIPKSDGEPGDDKRDQRARRTHEVEARPMSEPNEEGRRKPQAEEFGLLEQPVEEPEGGHDEDHEAAAVGHIEGGHGPDEDPHGEHADHDAMFFRAWQRTDQGNIIELRPDEIERDTSTFEEGRDPGIGPDPQTSPIGHDHEHDDPH